MFLLPLLVLLLGFTVYPILYGARLSLTDSTGVANGAFVGAENYRELLTASEFWASARVTAYYLLMTVPFELLLGLALALALSTVRRRGALMAIFFLPQVTSLVAIGMVIRWLFRSGDEDPMNTLLSWVGVPPQNWLGDPEGIFAKLGKAIGWSSPVEGPSLALIVVAAFTIWFYSGFHMVIYSAGLTAIPDELYEAARIDGAGYWRRLWHITIPLLSPTTYLLSVVAVIGSLQSFTLIFALGGASYGSAGSSGGPVGTTRVLTLYIFDNFYRFGRTGYAMAGAVVLFVLILTVTLLQRTLVERRVHYLN